MVDVNNASIDDLEAEIARRKHEAKELHDCDQGIVRRVLLQALENGLVGPAFHRVLLQCPNKGSYVTMFENGQADKFDIAITLIYRQDDA
jgi:hypothetical protein